MDTTFQEVAEKEGIHTPNASYGPVTIILGEGHVIPGLEEVLLTMEVGEEREVDIPPEQAFGKRNRSLVTTVPLKEFRRHGLKPQAGMRIEINEKWATIRSVSSGRVALDFNHPLSGKILTYTVSLHKRIEDTGEQIEAVIRLLGMRGRVVADGEVYSIKLDSASRGKERNPEELVKRKIEEYAPQARIAFS